MHLCRVHTCHVLLLLMLLTCTSGVHVRQEEQDGGAWMSRSVTRARCASRCLGLTSGGGSQNVSLDWCRADRLCATCLEPCKESWVMKKSSCDQMCQTTFPMMPRECGASCHFLEWAGSVKQGACPSPGRASGFEAACVQSCDRDQDCPKTRKCCSNDCGTTCQNPVHSHKGLPLKPSLWWFSEKVPGQMEVRWSCRSSGSVAPVVYLLQQRWNYGIQPSEDSATTWQDVGLTSSSSLSLSLQAGRWYQFRAAAVNSEGTRGFSTPTKHVYSSKNPSPPLPPSDLRLSDLSFGPGRSASARIIWNPPVDRDQDQDQDPDLGPDRTVPVQFYSVSWTWTSDETGTRTKPRPKKRTKNVREASLSLSSLCQNRTYSVQVRSVCFWKQNQLKSQKTTMQFSTRHAPGRSGSRSAQSFFNVGNPFFQDGQLRVHLYWRKDSSVDLYKVQWNPENCGSNNQTKQQTLTQDSFVSLPGLLFSCKYRVELQKVQTKTGFRSESESESRTFLTPSCSAVQAKSEKNIHCTEDRSSMKEKKEEVLRVLFI